MYNQATMAAQPWWLSRLERYPQIQVESNSGRSSNPACGAVFIWTNLYMDLIVLLYNSSPAISYTTHTSTTQLNLHRILSTNEQGFLAQRLNGRV